MFYVVSVEKDSTIQNSSFPGVGSIMLTLFGVPGTVGKLIRETKDIKERLCPSINLLQELMLWPVPEGERRNEILLFFFRTTSIPLHQLTIPKAAGYYREQN